MKRVFFTLSILIIIAIVNSCLGSKSTRIPSESCNDSSCILSFCSDYVDVDSEICSNSICDIFDMPVRYQETNGVPAESEVCGPTATSIILDSLVSYATPEDGTWTKNFKGITTSEDPTNSTSGCTGGYSNNLDCKKILATANKLCDTAESCSTWTEYSGYALEAPALTGFWENRIPEIDKAGKNIYFRSSGDFPQDIKPCDFISGDNSISTESFSGNVVLYMRYPQIVTRIDDYKGVSRDAINFEAHTGGHYIAMRGYDASKSDHILFFKFNCPAYGVKYYGMRNVKVGENFCVQYSGDNCIKYHLFENLPGGFASNTNITYLILNEGEENARDIYEYKFIANVTGVNFQ